MKPNHTWTGLVLIFVAALIGLWLVLIPSIIADQYERISQAGPFWRTAYLISVGSGALILLTLSIWIFVKLWRRGYVKRARRKSRARNPSEMSVAERGEEIDANLNAIRDFGEDERVDQEVQRELKPLLDSFEAKREAECLEIVAFGTVSSGKSALLNLLAGRKTFQSDARGGTTVNRSQVDWDGNDKVVLVDTPGLGEVDGAEHVAIAAESALNADLVLLVIDGPLRDHESILLQKLSEMEKRVIVCLNKGDWYSDSDWQALSSQLLSQLGNWVDDDDLIRVQAEPARRTRMRVSADGSEIEEEVEVPADIGQLSKRMVRVLGSEGKQLLMANLLLQSRGMLEQARESVKQSLDRHAWNIVDRYTWGAGGAAAVSPFPVVDLVAGCAISTKMVVELAKIYRQDVDLEMAINLMGQLGKNLIGILGVSAATPAVTSLVAGMLKAVPGVGTIAGGLLQGCVQALITRWIGAVFIEYLRNEMQQPEGGLSGLARRQWQQMTTANELRKLIQQARKHLTNSGSSDA